jgi:hypothetical protein
MQAVNQHKTMKNNQLNATLIASIVAQVMESLGQVHSDPMPKTSAKVKGGSDVAEMAVTNTRDADSIDIVLTQSMIDSRMKLPRRMFGSKDTVKIDGNEFVQDESDNGRSLKFDPAILGGKKVGQTLRFTFDKQTKSARHYDVQVIGKGQNSSAPAKAKTGKAKTKRDDAPTGKVKGGKVKTKTSAPTAEKSKREVDPNAQKIRACKTVNSLIETTGAIVIANEAKGIENKNIKDSGTFIDSLGSDARVFLPTAQSQAFRMTAKKLGLGLKKAVSLLNDEYEAYA